MKYLLCTVPSTLNYTYLNYCYQNGMKYIKKSQNTRFS